MALGYRWRLTVLKSPAQDSGGCWPRFWRRFFTCLVGIEVKSLTSLSVLECEFSAKWGFEPTVSAVGPLTAF